MGEIVLYPHQRAAIDAMHAKKGICWVKARVGSGKTVIAIRYIQEVNARTVLVLCPKSIIAQWQGEIERFDGSQRQWRVMNYEALLKDSVMRELLQNMPEVVIADESTKVKSGTGKIAKRFRKLQARYRVALADNLLPNSLSEMYSPVSWFAPDTLGSSYWQFQKKYCVMNPYVPQMIIGYNNERELMAYLQRFTVDVAWTGEDELPPGEREIIKINMTLNEAETYKKLRDECVLSLEGGEKITIPNILVKLTKLVQLINDPELFGLPCGSKEATLKALIHSTTGKIIIFSEHTQVLERFKIRYGGVLYTGKMGTGSRTAALEAFQGTERLLWSSASGSRGLNCQYAQTVVHYGLPLNNDAVTQRFGRINRLGQEKPVKEIVLLSTGSCDERIWRIIETKKNLFDKFNKNDYLFMLK